MKQTDLESTLVFCADFFAYPHTSGGWQLPIPPNPDDSTSDPWDPDSFFCLVDAYFFQRPPSYHFFDRDEDGAWATALELTVELSRFCSPRCAERLVSMVEEELDSMDCWDDELEVEESEGADDIYESRLISLAFHAGILPR